MDLLTAVVMLVCFQMMEVIFFYVHLKFLDENGNLKKGKADLFNKRTIKPKSKERIIENARDALIVSMQEKAKVDISYMQKLCGLDINKNA
ncbi:MAG: hypothetical protein L6V81_08290 [Clostridium sp.]|nr:MAG: hypothetical protein L6V81_08290 [Clostridium sp.]